MLVHRNLVLALLFGLPLAACRSTPPGLPEGEEMEDARSQLLAELRSEGVSDARVLRALERVPREEFVRPEDRGLAFANRALPIGGGQTISQPLIVGIMSQLLELSGVERVLEIGTGSGYQAAVLSQLARDVFSIEIDPQLAANANRLLERLGYTNVRVRAGDGFYGWEEEAPFDAVIITAVAPRIPERLMAQLRTEGVLVMPLEEGRSETLIRARKRADGTAQVERFGAVAFVPMRGAVRTPTTNDPREP